MTNYKYFEKYIMNKLPEKRYTLYGLHSSLEIDEDRAFLSAKIASLVGDWAGYPQSIIAEIDSDLYNNKGLLSLIYSL